MKVISVLILCFIVTGISAQQKAEQFFYLNGGLAIGNYWGGQTGINYVSSNNVSLQIEYSGLTRKAKSAPDDYFSGLVGVFAFGIADPHDKIHSLRFMAGKVKVLNPSASIRLNLKAGLSYITVTTPENYREQLGLFLVPNYEWDEQKTHQLGIVLKPEFEFIFATFIGATASPYFEFTKGSTSLGLGINLLLGKVRSRKII